MNYFKSLNLDAIRFCSVPLSIQFETSQLNSLPEFDHYIKSRWRPFEVSARHQNQSKEK